MRIASICCAAAAVLCLMGCPSFSTLQTARSLDKGQFQIAIAPQALGYLTTGNSGSTSGSTGVVPQFEVAGRYGITDNFDLGARIYFLGAEIESTLSIIKSDTFDLAFAPGVGYFGLSGTSTTGGTTSSSTLNIVPIYLNLLAGLPFGNGHEFVFGVKLLPYLIFAGGGSGSSSASAFEAEFFTGLTVGVSFKVANKFRIMPEFNIFYPVIAAASLNSGGSSTSAFGGGQAVFFQGGVGFAFAGNEFASKGAPDTDVPPPPPPPPPPPAEVPPPPPVPPPAP